MSIDLEKHLALKKAVDNFTKQKARDEGARDQIIKRLQKDFGCKSIEEAKEHIKDKDTEIEEMTDEYEKEMVKLKKSEWFKEIDDGD